MPFALALREYDVVKHQPHPPGYILYVALGRLVNVLMGDPAGAYVLLAMLFSAATTFVEWFVDHWSPTSARPRGLTEIEIPYGRFLDTLPVDRRPIAYAGYTLLRDR